MGIPERKERSRQLMRQAILDTAKRLFVEHSFEEVSIRRIAEEIEYSPRTIYLYFQDKDDILHALHTEGFDELYRRQLATLDVQDPLERLRRHAEVYIRFALDNPELYDLMFIMRGPAKKIKQRDEWDVGKRAYRFLVSQVKECMDNGLLPWGDPRKTSFALWSLTHGMVALTIRERYLLLPTEQAASYMEDTINYIITCLQRDIRDAHPIAVGADGR